MFSSRKSDALALRGIMHHVFHQSRRKPSTLKPLKPENLSRTPPPKKNQRERERARKSLSCCYKGSILSWGFLRMSIVQRAPKPYSDFSAPFFTTPKAAEDGTLAASLSQVQPVLRIGASSYMGFVWL